jgi:hypothetical protein
MGRDGSVAVVTRYRLDGRGLIPDRGKTFTTTPRRPNRLGGGGNKQSMQ